MARKMSNAGIMIREEIRNMTTSHLAPTKVKIEDEIKYAFWHEFICKDTYSELMKLVKDKYNDMASNFLHI